LISGRRKKKTFFLNLFFCENWREFIRAIKTTLYIENSLIEFEEEKKVIFV